MKLTKSALFILGVGIVAIALVYLTVILLGQGGERDTISSQLSSDTRTATSLEAQKLVLQTRKTQLNDQMTQVKTSYDRARTIYSLPLESIAYGQELFNTADSLQVQIVNLTMSKPSTAKIDNLNYRVMDINLDINGELDGITGFIETLANNQSFSGLSISSMSISQMNSAAALPHLHLSLRAYQYTGQ